MLSFCERCRTIDFVEKRQICLVLPDIRSLYNVGSFFRTADATGVTKIYCCGTTGTPKNPKLHKVALGSEHAVPWDYAPDPLTVIAQLRQAGYQIVVVEKTAASMQYTSVHYTEKVALIFGAETSGVPNELLAAADVVAHLPMFGRKNSLNVSVAGGVMLYYLQSAQ